MLAATPSRLHDILFDGYLAQTPKLLAHADGIAESLIAPVKSHLVPPIMNPAKQSPDTATVDPVDPILARLSMSRNKVERKLAAMLFCPVHEKVEIVERICAGKPLPSLIGISGTSNRAGPTAIALPIPNGTPQDTTDGT